MYKGVVLSSFASKELDDSFDWYEEHSAGFGERFVKILDEAFTVILENPFAFPKKKRNYRDMVLDTFPYIVVYEIMEKENVISVLHIFHTSRNPKLKYRLK